MSSVYETKFDVIFRKLQDKKQELKKEFDSSYSKDDFRTSVAVMESIQEVMSKLSSLEAVEKPFKEMASISSRIEDLKLEIEIHLEELGKEIRAKDELAGIFEKDLHEPMSDLLAMFQEEEGKNFELEFEKFSADELMTLAHYNKRYFPSRLDQYEEYWAKFTSQHPTEEAGPVNLEKSLVFREGIPLESNCVLDAEEEEEEDPEAFSTESDQNEESFDHGVEDLSEFERQNKIPVLSDEETQRILTQHEEVNDSVSVEFQTAAPEEAQNIETIQGEAQESAAQEEEAVTAQDIFAYEEELNAANATKEELEPVNVEDFPESARDDDSESLYEGEAKSVDLPSEEVVEPEAQEVEAEELSQASIEVEELEEVSIELDEEQADLDSTVEEEISLEEDAEVSEIDSMELSGDDLESGEYELENVSVDLDMEATEGEELVGLDQGPEEATSEEYSVEDIGEEAGLDSQYSATDYPQEEYVEGDYAEEEYVEGEYAQEEYSEGEYAQEAYVEGEYAEGEYAEGEYTQEDYAEGGHAQEDYAEGEYAEGEYAQEAYVEGEYAQEEYAEGEYAQDEYAQEAYVEGEYAQEGSVEGEYAQEGYAEGEYAQEGYAEGEYAQEEYAEGEYAQEVYAEIEAEIEDPVLSTETTEELSQSEETSAVDSISIDEDEPEISLDGLDELSLEIEEELDAQEPVIEEEVLEESPVLESSEEESLDIDEIAIDLDDLEIDLDDESETPKKKAPEASQSLDMDDVELNDEDQLEQELEQELNLDDIEIDLDEESL